MLEGVTVAISDVKDEIIIQGNDIEKVSQSAASITDKTRVKDKDVSGSLVKFGNFVKFTSSSAPRLSSFLPFFRVVLFKPLTIPDPEVPRRYLYERATYRCAGELDGRSVEMGGAWSSIEVWTRSSGDLSVGYHVDANRKFARRCTIMSIPISKELSIH